MPQGNSDPPAHGALLGKWLPLAMSLSSLALNIHGQGSAASVVDAIANVIAKLVDAESGGNDLLKSIKEDTEALRSEPFDTAIRSFADACRVGPEDPHWSVYIRRAEEKLNTAATLARTPQDRAVVEFNLSLAFAAINHMKNVNHHLDNSQQFADLAVRNFVFEARPNLTDRRFSIFREAGWGNLSLRIAGYYSGAAEHLLVGLPTRGIEITKEKRRRRTVASLRNFLPIYNTISHAHGSMAASDIHYLDVQDTFAGHAVLLAIRANP